MFRNLAMVRNAKNANILIFTAGKNTISSWEYWIENTINYLNSMRNVEHWAEDNNLQKMKRGKNYSFNIHCWNMEWCLFNHLFSFHFFWRVKVNLTDCFKGGTSSCGIGPSVVLSATFMFISPGQLQNFFFEFLKDFWREDSSFSSKMSSITTLTSFSSTLK